MIKILKEGKIPRATVECSNCHSLLEYGNADLHEFIPDNMSIYLNMRQYYFVCPVCGCDVITNWIHQD